MVNISSGMGDCCRTSVERYKRMNLLDQKIERFFAIGENEGREDESTHSKLHSRKKGMAYSN